MLLRWGDRGLLWTPVWYPVQIVGVLCLAVLVWQQWGGILSLATLPLPIFPLLFFARWMSVQAEQVIVRGALSRSSVPLATARLELGRSPEEQGRPLPSFVQREVEAYLRCGMLEHGLLRLGCPACGFERLVAFSCKKRGFCPSCLGRRMTETACHLRERVLPEVPLRQWVCSLPCEQVT